MFAYLKIAWTYQVIEHKVQEDIIHLEDYQLVPGYFSNTQYKQK